MKRTIQAVIFAAFFLSAYAQAGALLLSPGDQAYEGLACGSDCGPGMKEILTWLNTDVEDFELAKEVYKSDEDGDAYGSDSGEFASDYTAVFSNPVGDPADATISWNEGEQVLLPQWLLVKDGGTAPIWYLFDISGWDGMMDSVLTGFWPESVGISHVSIHAVPEPGTLALLGIGLLGVGLSRRKKAA